MREWLKELRLQKDMTQTEVAEMVGIAPHYYSYIENGKRCLPSRCDTEKKIAKVLGFDWTRFFEDTPGERKGGDHVEGA